MDNLDVQTNFMVGDAKDGKWSGVFVLPSGTEKANKLGQLSVVLSIGAPEGFDSKIAGDLLLENLQDTYYDDKPEGKIIPRLEKAILSAAKRLEYLLQREELASEKGIDLQVIATVVKDSYVYMAILGEGSIILSRDGVIIDLTEGLKDLSGRDLIQSGSGKFKANDSFVLLSPTGSMDISEDDLKTSMRLGNFENLSEKEKDPLLGVLMLQVKEPVDIEPDVAISVDEPIEEKESVEEDVEKKADEEGKFSEAEIDEMLEIEDVEQEKDVPQDVPEESTDVEEPTIDKKTSLSDKPKGALSSQLEKVKGLKDKVTDQLREKKTYQVAMDRAREIAIKVYELGKKYIWEGLLGMGGGRMYIKGAGPRRPIRGIIILIVLVVALLFLSLRALNRHSERSSNTSDVRDVLSAVEEQYTNGRNIGEAGDIEESVRIIEAAVAELENVKSYGELLEEIDGKIAEGVAIMDEVRRVIVLNEDNIITDVAGYIEGATASDITLFDGQVYIVDESNGGLYKTSVSGGEVSSVLGDSSSFSRPSSLVVDNDGNLIVYDKDRGMIKVHVSESRTESLVGLSQTSVGAITDVDNYVTPDGLTQILYVLRAENNDVRKISKYASGYSLPELRLANSNFSTGKDIEIDGRIYILTANGIIRYFADTQDPFVLTGLDKTINGSTAMELDDKLLFVGDSANKRIVVLTKGSTLSPQQGKYVVQFDYRGEGDYLADIRDIVVDDSGRVMYVLAGTKIFKVELFDVDKHAEKLL